MKLVGRTIQVLELLAEHPEGASLSAVREFLAEPASSLHRLLRTLIDLGYVWQDVGTKRYYLGPGILRIANSYSTQNRVVEIAKPHLTRLTQATFETAFLSRLIGDDVICIATSPGPRQLSYFMRVGERTPYHCASSARAILAFADKKTQDRLLESETLERFTPLTPTSVDEARNALELTRRQDYAVCDRELEEGVTAYSAAIRDPDGAVRSSLTIVGPTERMTAARDALVSELRDAAVSVSTDLGYVPNDMPLPGAKGELRAAMSD